MSSYEESSKKKHLLNPSFKGSKRFSTEDPRVVKAIEDAIGNIDLGDKQEGSKPRLVRWPTGFHPLHATVADLCDFFLGKCEDLASKPSPVKVLHPGLRDFGGISSFSGVVTTVKCWESNRLLTEVVQEDGTGRVLVVDGGASMRCALMGDLIAELAAQRGWSGIIINGCVRDVAELSNFQVGIKALASNPMKPGKTEIGQRDVPVIVCGVTIYPNDWIYADADGVITSSVELKLPEEGRPTEKVPLIR